MKREREDVGRHRMGGRRKETLKRIGSWSRG